MTELSPTARDIAAYAQAAAAVARREGPTSKVWLAVRPAAAAGSPRAFTFSSENAVCKDSYRRQCRE